MFIYVSQLSEACKLLLREDGREGKFLSGRHKALQTHNLNRMLFCVTQEGVSYWRENGVLGKSTGLAPGDPGFVMIMDKTSISHGFCFVIHQMGLKTYISLPGYILLYISQDCHEDQMDSHMKQT